MAKKKGTGNNGQLSLFGGSTTQQLNNQLADIERKITALYGSTYKYAAQLAQVRAAVNSGQEFTWQENPAAAKAIEQRLNAVANTLDGQLSKATAKSYSLGQASTEHALTKALGKDKATKQEVEDINADAAAEMRRRGADGHTYYTQKRGGVTISDKVWNITESTKLEIEIAIQNAALEGHSADDLARTIQQYLEHPERLFRSVRVKDPVTGEWTGEYRMSKAAQQCHPGQGVYRSSYKNALRLARTELTQAYRRAEWESYQDNPLITGYRIELSNNHTTTVVTKKGRRVEHLRDICDEMAGTQYPKTFLWTGWHPQCRCRMVPITITTDDFKERVKARHRGKLDEWKPKEQTTEMPAAFTKWVDENKHRWQQPGHAAPFFIRDNYQQGNVAKGLDTRITAELEQARLAAEAIKAKEPPTPQPITDYDTEVMELRSIAAKYDIDLGGMERVRAEGEDKKALRKEINVRQRLWRNRENYWHELHQQMADAVNKLFDLITNEGDNEILMQTQAKMAEYDNMVSEYSPTGSMTYNRISRTMMRRITEINNYTQSIREKINQAKGQNTIEQIKKEFNIRGIGNLEKTDVEKFDLVGLKKLIKEIGIDKDFDVDNCTITTHKHSQDWDFEIRSSKTARSSRYGYDIPVFTLERKFYHRTDGLEVHHEYFQLADRVQRQGISKKLFPKLYEEYKKLGVRYITVQANLDVGGYTWAEYGFYANNRYQAENAVHGNSKALKIIDDFYKGKTDDTPFPMLLISKQPWGQQCLLGSNWHGTIDLQNEEQVKLWEKYLGLRG